MRILAHSMNGDGQAAEWVAIAFTQAEAWNLPACSGSPESVGHALCDLADESSDWVAVVRETLWCEFLEASRNLIAEFPEESRAIGVVLPWREPPRIEVRGDGEVSLRGVQRGVVPRVAGRASRLLAAPLLLPPSPGGNG